MEERTARRGRQELRFETKRIVVPIRKDSNGGVSEKEPGISCVSSCPWVPFDCHRGLRSRGTKHWVVERTFAWLNQFQRTAGALRKAGGHSRGILVLGVCSDLLALPASRLGGGVKLALPAIH